MRALTSDELHQVVGGQDAGGGGTSGGGGDGGSGGSGGSGGGDAGGGSYGGGGDSGGGSGGGYDVGWGDFPVSEPAPGADPGFYPPIDATGPTVKFPNDTTVSVGVTDDGQGGGVVVKIPF